MTVIGGIVVDTLKAAVIEIIVTQPIKVTSR